MKLKKSLAVKSKLKIVKTNELIKYMRKEK